MTDLVAAAIAEITFEHEFFVRWLVGESDKGEFALWQRGVAPDFRLVSPDGIMRDIATVTSWIEPAHGSVSPGFMISVDEPEPVWANDEAVLLSYVERQYREGRTTRRRSLGLFTREPDAPRGVVLRHLQETWMPAADET